MASGSCDVADSLGLQSDSFGEGDDRYVVVFRKDGELPPEVLERMQEEEALQAEAARLAAKEVEERRQAAEVQRQLLQAEARQAAASTSATADIVPVQRMFPVRDKRSIAEIQAESRAKRLRPADEEDDEL